MNIDISKGKHRDKQLDRAAEILKVLGHPVRLRIVISLLHDDCNVKRIWQKLELPQATISQHLAQLKAKGIVESRRDGVKMCYSVCDELAERLVRSMISGCNKRSEK
ncbi:MAG: metalloregulator ArsR/SmtB family transcription factor [Candidatus Alcyoniella australis]|nr:metalloregulator ArsR/SmtB family transcription factor [Candidatus Alcyoniella australis]